MAIKASATVTLSFMIDIVATYRYYKLQSSIAAAPAVPTDNPPSDWVEIEPSYAEGSTDTLYFVDLTVFSDDTWLYSKVNTSSSYEAAKAAYNKAQAAQDRFNDYSTTDETTDYITDELDKLSESIDNAYISTDDLDSYATKDSVTQVSERVADWEANKESITGSIAGLKITTNELGSFQEEVEARMVFTMDDVGTPSLILGSTSSRLKTNLTNEKLEFLEDNTPISWISGHKTYNESVEVLRDMKLGGFSFVKRSNGNLSIKWVGE